MILSQARWQARSGPTTAVATGIQVDNNNVAMTTDDHIDSSDSAYCLAIESNEFVRYGISQLRYFSVVCTETCPSRN